jgi:LSD1 subclass zinc finger protein
MNHEDTLKYLAGAVRVICADCKQMELRANCAYYKDTFEYRCPECHVKVIDGNLNLIEGSD